jgi:hypothetical protein
MGTTVDGGICKYGCNCAMKSESAISSVSRNRASVMESISIKPGCVLLLEEKNKCHTVLEEKGCKANVLTSDLRSRTGSVCACKSGSGRG